MTSVLIVQRNRRDRRALTGIFEELGHQVRSVKDLAGASAELREIHPGLLVLDISLVRDEWPKLVRRLRERLHGTRILLTAPSSFKVRNGSGGSNGASPTRVLYAPFTRLNVELALLALEDDAPFPQPEVKRIPGPKIALRTKITLPYVLLAFCLAVAAVYLATRIVLDSVEERYTNQLIEAGRLSSEWMVREEDRLLETQRLLANTEGMGDAVLSGDADRLRALAYPIAVNGAEEAVEILNDEGVNLLSLHHHAGDNLEVYDANRGFDFIRGWDVARSVLEGRMDALGDKFAGTELAPWGATFYVAGPIRDNSNRQVGVILVGKSVATLARQMREATLAQISLYDFEGRPLATTFLEPTSLEPGLAAEILVEQGKESQTRPLDIANITYREILGPWKARKQVDLGVIGVSLPQTFLVRTSRITRLQIFGFVTLAFALVILIGMAVAERITRPLLQVVRASVEVARGNLKVKLEPKGNDEVSVLAESFNDMVLALQRSQVELLEAYDSTLEGWAKALEIRDDNTEGHTRRVVDMTLRLCRSLGVEESRLLHIRRGALLHDIGKVGIPDRVLLKPGPLTEDEWAIMRRHPMYAHEMLSGIAYLRPSLDIPHYHHERWDGSGYPIGLKGEEIPFEARIFSVVDVWDALSSDRPYRAAWPQEAVLQYLSDHAGTQFDPRVVECFLHMIRGNMNGSLSSVPQPAVAVPSG